MNDYLLGLHLSKEEQFFASHIEDLAYESLRKNIAVFSQFLDLRQQKIAKAAVDPIAPGSFMFFGGTEDAERKILGIFPDYVYDKIGEYPISVLRILHSRPLTHRDFLGAFMSLGIKRELLGDILVGECETYFFLQPSLVSFVTDNIEKIGNVGVKIESCNFSDIKLTEQRFSDETAIISSLRLDCVVAAVADKSRNDVSKLILGEKVNVNHEIVSSCSKSVCEGDVISVRSVGKFKIGNVVTQTKKGRLVLSYKKYI